MSLNRVRVKRAGVAYAVLWGMRVRSSMTRTLSVLRVVEAGGKQYRSG